jgi:O-antigen/teichoic acid export membrane protein
MNKRQIGRNAIASILQILINGAILFVLYRFLLEVIGAKQFGIWSLVMAFTSFASVANLGFPGSVVKFVAQSMAYEDSKKASQVIQTSAIAIAVISGALILAAFPLIRWGLRFVVSGDALASAVALLPFSFLAFWLMMIAGVFLSALDGYKRTDMRSSLLVGVSAINLLLCILLVPQYGLMGLAYSVIAANLCALLLSWLLIRKNNPLLPLFPSEWRTAIFKEVVGYAAKFQIISLAVMLFEPLTKAFLGKFGGLSMVAFYEMASRLIQQLRALIVSAYAVLVPVLAEYKETSPEKIPTTYSKSYEIIYYLALPAFALLILWLPLISKLWIGHVESIFVLMGSVLAVGLFLNTLAVPAYVVSLGSGELKWNVIGHVATAILNLLLGYIGGLYFGGYGVVIGATIALLIGSILTSFPFQLEHNISIANYFPRASRKMTYLIIAGIIIVQLPISYSFGSHKIIMETFYPLVFLIIAICMMYVHPLRIKLKEWIILGLFGLNQNRIL